MKLDQHFLVNEKIAKLMASGCKIDEKSTVVEIGPGNGEVTRFIPKCNLTLIEKDGELAEKLKQKFNAKIVVGDGVSELRKRDFDFLISSVPYSISEPLVRELMLHGFKKAVLILPEKFIESILEPRTSFSFIANNLLGIKIIKTLEKSDFEPEPGTSSVVVGIAKNKKASRILEKLYLQQDKKLKNALREAIVEIKKTTKNKAREIIENLDLDKQSLDKSLKTVSLEVIRQIAAIKI